MKKINSKKLCSLVKFSNESWNQKDYFENEFPYVEIGEIDLALGKINKINFIPISEAPSRARMVIRKDDIIISTTRPSRGAVAYVRDDGIKIASTGFAVIRNITNETLVKKYLFNVLKTKLVLLQMEMRQSGGNYPSITQEELKKIVIPLPQKDIQQRIVVLMDAAYKSKQEKEARAKELLESIEVYLLNELGIVLPQVDGNTIESRINYISSSEVLGNRLDLSNIQSIKFKKILQSSKYKLLKLRNFIKKIKTGTTPSSGLNPYSENGIPFLRNTNLQKGELDLTDIKYVKEEHQNKLIYSYKNEVIVCIAGTVGEAAINKNDKALAINQNISSLQIDEDKLNLEFITFYFNTRFNIEFIKSQCSMGTIYYLNNSNLLGILIPNPPLEIQNKIANHIQKIRDEAKKLEEEAKADLEKAKEEVEKILLGE